MWLQQFSFFLIFSFNLVFSERVVVDLSRYESNIDFVQAKESGIKAVILKATEGSDFVDKTFYSKREQVLDAGLLLGTYHFGLKGNGTSQADHFLRVSRLPNGTYPLMALDIEPSTSSPSRTIDLATAEEIVRRIFEVTGIYPVIYGGSHLKDLVRGKNTILTNGPLWLSRYIEKLPARSIPDGWSRYALWQYTDGTTGGCPKTTVGMGKVDRSDYNNDYYGNIESFFLSRSKID